eukprot:5914932-Amphidinium_carterae.1
MDVKRANSKTIGTALPGMDEREPVDQSCSTEGISLRRKIPKDHCCGCTRALENSPHTNCA